VNAAIVRLRRRDGSIVDVRVWVSEDQATRLKSARRWVKTAAERELFKTVRTSGLAVEGTLSWSFISVSRAHGLKGLELRVQDELRKTGANDVEPAPRVARCRLILRIAHRVLPPGMREDALDEWMDEIECTAEKGRPVLKRTFSILFRSLPVLAWRSRGPARVRGGGG
jgi:hypothetical protein